MNSHEAGHCARVAALNKVIKAEEDKNPDSKRLKQEITELESRIVHAVGAEREQLKKQKVLKEIELKSK